MYIYIGLTLSVFASTATTSEFAALLAPFAAQPRVNPSRGVNPRLTRVNPRGEPGEGLTGAPRPISVG